MLLCEMKSSHAMTALMTSVFAAVCTVEGQLEFRIAECVNTACCTVKMLQSSKNLHVWIMMANINVVLTHVHVAAFVTCIFHHCGLGCSVSIATDYGLDGLGFESRWGWDFSAPVQIGPGAHPASCTMGTGSFPGVKCGLVMMLTTHPRLVRRSWKSRAIPLPTLWATRGL
jgi:hypothetical protein